MTTRRINQDTAVEVQAERIPVAYVNLVPNGRMIAGRMVGAYERVLIENGVITEELQFQVNKGLITIEWK